MAPAAALAVALVGAATVYWGYLSIAQDQRLTGLAARADAARLRTGLVQIQEDIALLADAMPVREFTRRIALPQAEADRDELDRLRRDAASLLESLLRTRPDYYQARVLDTDGVERIRIERSAGRIFEVPRADLQDKSAEPYVPVTLALPAGRRYFSGINLNRERGAIETPNRPVLRAAMPQYDTSGVLTGMVIINLDFRSFIERFLSVDSPGFRYFLANSDGEFVLHPDPSRAFAFEFGASANLRDEFAELESVLSSGDPAAAAVRTDAAEESGRLAAARRVYHVLDEPSRFVVLSVAAAPSSLLSPAGEIGATVLQTTLVLVLLVAVGAATFATRLSNPLRQLADDATAVGAGSNVKFRTLDRADEVGTLSRALHAMLGTIERDQQALKEYNRDLEFFIKSSSHDLVEPARRIALLADMLGTGASALDSADARSDIERIGLEGHRIVSRLADLRDFVQNSAAGMNREPANLRDLVAESVAEFLPEFEVRGIALHIHDLPTYPVYAGLVRVLYRSLIQNVLQMSDESGLQIDCRYSRSDAEVIFEVRGASNRQRESAVAAGADEGTVFDWSEYSGHGLSLCRRLVERHGGKAWSIRTAGMSQYFFTLDGNHENE